MLEREQGGLRPLGAQPESLEPGTAHSRAGPQDEDKADRLSTELSLG